MITVPDTQMNVLLEVAHERLRQDVKWGEQNHNDSRWSHILGEEYGEAMTEVNNIVFGRPLDAEQALRTELTQVAAVAVAWIECIDRRAHGSRVRYEG